MNITLPQHPRLPEATPAAAVPSQTAAIGISLEAFLYLAIVISALILRIVALDTMPLDDTQAHEALAALHRANPDLVQGEPIAAQNSLMAFANQLSFIFLDHSNFSARFATALMGTFLTLAPLLWRRWLGRTAALIMSLMLAISPVALTASRTLGSLTWTMALLMIGIWLIGRYLESPHRRFSIAATITFGLLLFATDPAALVIVMGLLVGLAFALWSSRHSLAENTPTATLRQTLSTWTWLDGVLATIAALFVVSTAFFTAPDGLSSLATSLTGFAQGFFERSTPHPNAFVFISALRYDTAILVFGLIGLYFALTEGDFFEKFLAGWFLWGLLTALLYTAPNADAALWLTIPAAALSALLVARMFRSASSGYWVVPNWAIPVHAATTAAFVVAMILNAVTLSQSLQREARPAYNHVLPTPTSSARIGTFDEQYAVNLFQIASAQATTITVQLVRIDSTIDPIVQVELNNQVIIGPFSYESGRRGLVFNVDLQPNLSYTLRVIQNPDQAYQRGQFFLLTHDQNASSEGLLGSTVWEGYKLDLSWLWAFTRLVSNQTRSVRIMVMLFTLMLIVILYFLAGSLWGNRAAWRGLGFGILAYMLVYGVGLAWQTSFTYADDPREIWYNTPPTTKLNRLVDTLQEMSLHDKGNTHSMPITVQGKNDTALAWALRSFEHVTYVTSLSNQVNTSAVIAPFTDPKPNLGASYVGQDFVLNRTWQLSELSWLDFFAWLTHRDTRFNPIDAQPTMLWVRQDVYGVEQVPTD